MVPSPDDVSIPFFIGLLFMCILYGTTVEQAVRYFSVYPKYMEWHSLLIIILLLFDAAHVLFLSIASSFVIFSWRDPSRAANMISWSLPTSFALSYAITFVVQCFFLTRIWILSWRNKIATTAIALFGVLQLAAGMAVVVELTNNQVLMVDDRLKTCVGLQLSSSLVTDLAIMLAFVYYLNRGRSALECITATDSAISRIMTYVIFSGLVTILVILINIILFMTAANNFNWIVPQAVSSKLYVISLLATLNSRQSVRDLIDRQSKASVGILGLSAHRFSPIMKIEPHNAYEFNASSSLSHTSEYACPAHGEHDSLSYRLFNTELLSTHPSQHGSKFVEPSLSGVDETYPNLPIESKLTLGVAISSGTISPSPTAPIRSPAPTALFSPISPSAALSPVSAISSRGKQRFSWDRVLAIPSRTKSSKSNRTAEIARLSGSNFSFMSSSGFAAHTFNTARRTSTETGLSGAALRYGRSDACPSTRLLPPLPTARSYSDTNMQVQSESDTAITLVKITEPADDGVLRIVGINAPKTGADTHGAIMHASVDVSGNTMEYLGTVEAARGKFVRVVTPLDPAFIARGRQALGGDSESIVDSCYGSDSSSDSCSRETRRSSLSVSSL